MELRSGYKLPNSSVRVSGARAFDTEMESDDPRGAVPILEAAVTEEGAASSISQQQQQQQQQQTAATMVVRAPSMPRVRLSRDHARFLRKRAVRDSQEYFLELEGMRRDGEDYAEEVRAINSPLNQKTNAAPYLLLLHQQPPRQRRRLLIALQAHSRTLQVAVSREDRAPTRACRLPTRAPLNSPEVRRALERHLATNFGDDVLSFSIVERDGALVDEIGDARVGDLPHDMISLRVDRTAPLRRGWLAANAVGVANVVLTAASLVMVYLK